MELTEIRNRYFEKLDCFRNEFPDFQTFLELGQKIAIMIFVSLTAGALKAIIFLLIPEKLR